MNEPISPSVFIHYSNNSVYKIPLYTNKNKPLNNQNDVLKLSEPEEENKHATLFLKKMDQKGSIPRCRIWVLSSRRWGGPEFLSNQASIKYQYNTNM